MDLTWVMVFIIIIVSIVGIFILWDMLQFKHTFVARIRTRNRVIVRKTKAKEITIDGNVIWQLQKRNIVPQTKGKINAPGDAADIDHKGKKWAEGYVTDGFQVTWIEDNPNKKEFDSIEREERIAYMQQLKKAEEEKPKQLLQMLINHIPIMMFAMVLIVLIIFGGDLLQAYADVEQAQAYNTEKMAEVSEAVSLMLTRAEAITSGKQIINDKNNGEISLPKKNE